LLNISINAQAVGIQKLYQKSIMATFHGIWSMAGFAGAAVGYFMVSFNIAPAYHFVAVSVLLFAVSLYFFKDTLYEEPIRQERKGFMVFPEKALLKYALVCFACMACENTMYDWSGIYFEKAVHVSKATATLGFVVYMTAMTLGRLFGDKLISRFGIKPILKFSGIFIFMGLSIAVALPYAITAGIGFVLTGFGVSCVVPMIFQIAGKSTTMSSGSALASISSIGYIGFLLVPPFVGFVAQAVNLRLSFAVMALLGGMIVVLVRGMKTD
jgi:fucose permease